MCYCNAPYYKTLRSQRTGPSRVMQSNLLATPLTLLRIRHRHPSIYRMPKSVMAESLADQRWQFHVSRGATS